MRQKEKVLVGISGGVDSSVSALLLQQQGYHVEGVFVKVWQPDFIECNWREEMRDAMRVCAQLEIPFHFLDLEKEYKEEVVDYMIEEYKKGRTPNPDVMCNKYIKFGHLFDFAEKNGFDFVATGHYAQNKNNKLYRGTDEEKDQSYFLWTLTEDKLKKIIFPLGHLTKKEVRKIAKKNNLFTSEKKDSQGICFMGPVDMKEFLKQYVQLKPGSVVDETGKSIGEHDGAILYTIGERHGFRINPKNKKTDEKSFYVVSKNISENTITVSGQKEPQRNIQQVLVKKPSFIDKKTEAFDTDNTKIEFQTRYRQKPQKGLLQKDGQNLIITSDSFEELPALGQSIVWYKDRQCLGGGSIDSVVY